MVGRAVLVMAVSSVATETDSRIATRAALRWRVGNPSRGALSEVSGWAMQWGLAKCQAARPGPSALDTMQTDLPGLNAAKASVSAGLAGQCGGRG